MNRLHQIVLIASTVLGSWLGMQAVHESGHVLGAWMTGGKVARVVLHPLNISRTDLAHNPNPLVVVWAGPLLGVMEPLLVGAIVASTGLRMPPPSPSSLRPVRLPPLGLAPPATPHGLVADQGAIGHSDRCSLVINGATGCLASDCGCWRVVTADGLVAGKAAVDDVQGRSGRQTSRRRAEDKNRAALRPAAVVATKNLIARKRTIAQSQRTTLGKQGAALAIAGRAAGPGVVRETTVADGRYGAEFDVNGGGISECKAAAADGVVVAKCAVQHREGWIVQLARRKPETHDACTVAAVMVTRAVAACNLIPRECAACHGSVAQVQDRAAERIVPRAGLRNVVLQQAIREGQARADLVGDAAAIGGIRRGARAAAADGLVVQQRAIGDRQGARIVNAASLYSQAVGDRQAADGNVLASPDFKYATGIVAANGQLVRTWPVDGHAAGDVQLAVGQRDGAVQTAGEVDSGTRGGIGGLHRRPQRAGAVVVEVRHQVGTGHDAIFQLL